MPRLRTEQDAFYKYRCLVLGTASANGISKCELGGKVGVCPKTLNSYLENPGKMPLDIMRRINRILGISAEDARAALPMW